MIDNNKIVQELKIENIAAVEVAFVVVAFDNNLQDYLNDYYFD